MRVEWRPGLLIGGFLAAACVHNDLGGVALEADSLGRPGLVLSRALSRVQRMDYTVTALDSQRFRFRAEHHGTSLASLFGSDSNCALEVRTAPASRPDTSRIVITWRARNAGSLAGCRRDAEAILKAATGEERRVEEKKRAPLDPVEELHGGL
jgi:hypothetical protein